MAKQRCSFRPSELSRRSLWVSDHTNTTTTRLRGQSNTPQRWQRQVFDYALTTARPVPAAKPAAQQWGALPSSVQDQQRDRLPNDIERSALAPGSVRKLSPRHDPALVPASAISAPAFHWPVESLPKRVRREKVDAR